MSWLYSRELVAASLPDNCLDGEPSAQWKTTPMPQAYLWQGRMMEAWSRFPSGMTSEPLTGDLGEVVLMSYLEAFPVKTSALQEAAPASLETNLDCGWRWPESSVKYCRARSLWRTRQCSLVGDLDVFSETWPRWGMMRDGESWELTKPEPLTRETVSGLLPTPTQSYGSNHGGSEGRTGPKRLSLQAMANQGYLAATPGKLNPMWLEWLMGWPIGWTDLNALEMDKCQQWRDLHGKH